MLPQHASPVHVRQIDPAPPPTYCLGAQALWCSVESDKCNCRWTWTGLYSPYQTCTSVYLLLYFMSSQQGHPVSKPTEYLNAT